MIVYDQPNPDGTNDRVLVTEEEAVESMRSYTQKYFPDRPMLSDEKLLEDFMTVHWAWRED